MRIETRSDCSIALLLEPEEVVNLQGAVSLDLSEEFRVAAQAAAATRTKRIAEDAWIKELAVEAAASCPVKVGQEVRDPSAWRNQEQWWRVCRVEGSPASPTLLTRAIRADGSNGVKVTTFYKVEGLEVRDNTEGGPPPRRLPGVKLGEIAKRIDAHLRAIESAQAPGASATNGALYRAGAYVAGGRVGVRYVSFQSTWNLPREEAAAYLERLDGGFRGKHFQVPGGR